MECKFIADIGMHYPKEGSPKKYRYYLVECPECKDTFSTQARHFKNGNMKSCLECKYKIMDQSKFNLRHGLRRHPLYGVWCGMKSRCYNANKRSYVDYGARGITVCDEWLDDFRAFYDWSVGRGHVPGKQIDRIDGNKGYSPSNCRFVSPIVNINNVCRIRKNNTTGFSGVTFDSKGNKYVAQISSTVGGKRKNTVIGRFETAEEASEEYINYRKHKLKTINPKGG